MERRQVEILAPAGSFESMKAAAMAGADAVYIGGNRFGARAYADNLEEDRMKEAIDYMHLHGKRLYMTVNTLMKDSEMKELFDYLNPYYMQGLDAVIVQDLGTFAFIKEHFPGLAIHASTQMTVTGAYGAKLLKEMGADRVVTARELSLDEIAEIKKNVDIEIESFVHGALCYCYSGQCLLSSVIGGRSGNRGRCAQPCRLPYDVSRNGKVLNKKDERYVMSLKDLCTLDLIPDMIEAGVYSMKIEGRMKSPRYTAGVTSVYRKYVDLYLSQGRKGFRVDPADKRLLLDLFDRGGFTEGYYKKHNGRDMVALHEKPAFREANQELFQAIDEAYVTAENQEPITGKAVLNEGEPAALSVTLRDITITEYGKTADTAQNQPITEEKLLRQINKTGGSDFRFEELSAEIGGRPFIPVQALNELRRNAFERLKEEALLPYRRESGMEQPFSRGNLENGEYAGPFITASAERTDVALRLASLNGISRIYIDANTVGDRDWPGIVNRCHEYGKECYLMLPQIFRTEARDYFNEREEAWKKAGFDGMLLRSLEEVAFVKEKMPHMKLMFDSCIYSFNHLAREVLLKMGADMLTLPAELNERELKYLGCEREEMIVYGYLPVMVSAQCIKRTTDGCTKQPELLYMKDRMGKEFPVRNHCRFCYNTIYNTTPLSLLGDEERILALRPKSVRLQFTIEEEETAVRTASDFISGLLEGKKMRPPAGSFTRGHFKRGVE